MVFDVMVYKRFDFGNDLQDIWPSSYQPNFYLHPQIYYQILAGLLNITNNFKSREIYW